MNNSAYLSMYLFSMMQPDVPLKLSFFYHVLTGKRTASTLYQAKKTNLLPILGLLEDLTRDEFEKLISFWSSEKWIDPNFENMFQLNQTGKRASELYFQEKPRPIRLNFARYGKVLSVFWNRYQLLVQVLVNKKVGIKKYDPIITNRYTQLWVKEWIRSSNIQNSTDQLADETIRCFKELTDQQALLMSESLTGNLQIGKTASQRALDYGLNQDEERLVFLETIQQFYLICEKDPTLTILHQLAIDADRDSGMGVTASTLETVQLIESGMNPHQIAVKRNLKEGTIWEHGIEWSILHSPDIWIALIPSESYKAIELDMNQNPKLNFKKAQERGIKVPFAWYRLIEIERMYEK